MGDPESVIVRLCNVIYYVVGNFQLTYQNYVVYAGTSTPRCTRVVISAFQNICGGNYYIFVELLIAKVSNFTLEFRFYQMKFQSIFILNVC